MLKGKTVLLAVTGSIAAYKNSISGQRTAQTSRAGTCAHDCKRHEFHQSHYL